MNSRERFRETMRYGVPDRVPCFEEGIRREVFTAWRRQGLKRDSDLRQMFPYDRLEEIEPDLEPLPRFRKWPTSRPSLDSLRKHLDPADARRLPGNWQRKVRSWKDRDHVLMLRVHRGLFLSMGVSGWQRFDEVASLLIEDPEFCLDVMLIQGRFAARMAERILRDVEIDAALFVEPIADNHGTLISPKMYRELVMVSYEPVIEVLRLHGVETVIFLSFANPRLLLPVVLRGGLVNCLWAYEADSPEMDYRDLRREFGRDLRLIGGIDLDALRRDKEAIRKEMEEKVPALLADGGYIPLVDGRVREDIPFENYVYYRQLLDRLTAGRAHIKTEA
jgi:hypothetical protein